MLALVVTSVPPIWNGSRSACCSRSASASAHRFAVEVCSIRIANSSPPRRATMSAGRTWCWMRRATCDQELVAGAVAQRVVDQLEAVEVEEHHREAALRVGAGSARSPAPGMLVEARAVGQAGQAVVEGDVVQPRLGVAARGDVLHLQDQARRARSRRRRRSRCAARPRPLARRGGGSAVRSAKPSSPGAQRVSRSAKRGGVVARARSRRIARPTSVALAARPAARSSARLACSTWPSSDTSAMPIDACVKALWKRCSLTPAARARWRAACSASRSAASTRTRLRGVVGLAAGGSSSAACVSSIAMIGTAATARRCPTCSKVRNSRPAISALAA